MITKKLLPTILLGYLLITPVWAFAASGGNSLTEPLGARQVAMGSAYTALSGDCYALHYNIAGIADIQSPMLSSMYAMSLFQTTHTFLIFGMPTSLFGDDGIAISIMNYIGDNIEINHLDGTSERRQSQNDFIGTAGYAIQLAPGFSLGVSAKLFQSTLAEKYTATASSSDIGLLLKNAGGTGLNVGATLQHIGSDIKYLDEGDPMPTTLRIGMAYENTIFSIHGIKLSADGLFPNDHTPYQNLGIEYAWQNTLFVRAGYKFNYDMDTFSIGGGIHFDSIHFDYAYSGFSTDTNAHRVGLGYAFKQF